MRNMPEIPLNLDPADPDNWQTDGDKYEKPIYQTQRGKIPEGHEDDRPVVDPPMGALRYREVE